MRPVRSTRVLIGVMFATLGMGGVQARLQAQVLPMRPDSLRLDLPQTAPGQQAQETGRAPGESRAVLLEQSVSRTGYALGPGDVLTLALFGFQNQVFNMQVTPEGTIVIPTVGVVSIDGLTLEEAEIVVRRRVRRFYTDAEISLSLIAVRSFKVYLLGDVEARGMRSATAVARVSELVPMTDSAGIVRRNVVVRRAGGDSIRVDLARFLQMGDMDSNPFLHEGDVVYVPPVDQTVSITGRVSFPGTYAFRPGETLASMLQLANGGGELPADAADSLRIRRFRDRRESDILVLAVSDAVGATGRNMTLQPFDAVYVPRYSRYKSSMEVRVQGEVERPGVYPIESDVTSVGDLVSMAGGLTERASLADAVLRRRAATATEQTASLESVPPELLSPQERRVLQVTRRADDTNVVLDVRDLISGGQSPSEVTLRDGDVLTVPELREQVVVVGAVFQPGILPYQAGMAIEDYVALAGGYTRRADRGSVVVLKGKLGNQLDRRDVRFLEPGDRIVVPFEEHVTFIDRVREVGTVVSTVSSVILTIVALDRIW